MSKFKKCLPIMKAKCEQTEHTSMYMYAWK